MWVTFQKTVQVIVGRVSKKESFSSNEQKDGVDRTLVHNKDCMQLSLIQWDPTAVPNICWEALFCLQGMLH